MKSDKAKGIDKASYFSLKGFNELQWYTALVFVLAFLLIGWVSIMSLLGFSVSFGNIVYLHRYVFVWIFDICILLIPIAYLYVLNFRRIRLDILSKKIDSLEGEIESSIVMASKIGSGQELSSDETDKSSELHKTLMSLGKNLAQTREKELQLSWVIKGKEIMSDILRQHTNMQDLAVDTLQGTVSYFDAVQGAFYILEEGKLRSLTQYAYNRQRYETSEIEIGRGLIGAAAYEKQIIYRTEIPNDYFTITSGMINDKKPKSLLIIPLIQEDEVQGVIELSFFQKKLSQQYLSLAEEYSKIIGSTVHSLKSNIRTEMLLRESQKMTATLRENEEKLRQNAQEMILAQDNLEASNRELAGKIEEVENAQKRLRALLTNASEFISIYDENRNVTFESPSIKRILGYEEEDEVHGMDEDLMTPKGYRGICQMFEYLENTPGGEMTQQYTYLKKDGTKIFLETQGKNLLHDPAIRGLIFNTRDITERIRAEKEERMKSRMQSLSENSPDMIIRTSTNGRIVYANPATARFFQMGVQDLVNVKIAQLQGHETFVQFISESIRAIKKTCKQEESEIEVEVNGEIMNIEIKAIPEFGDNEDLESILFAAHDVTDLKKIEAEIKEKNKKIQDSINYAKRIQTAILPDVNVFQKYFPNSFMFYRPKDVVSGDFPWFFHYDDIYYIAAVDCTGHGVPGALLSFIGYFLLDNIADTARDITAAETLDRLHAAVRTTLKQDQDGANGRDGMDLGLCRIDTQKKEIQFAGAHRPLYYMRNGEFAEYKASRKGIGGIPLPGRPEPNFENNVINYQAGDRFFVFSDGLPDQLGGGPGVKKKYQTKRFKELLERNKSESMVAISQDVIKDFYGWVGDEKQVDDVLLIGIEL